MNAQTLKAVVGGIVPVVREYVAQQIAPIAAENDGLRAEVRSLRTEIETRAAIPAPAPAPEDVVVEYVGEQVEAAEDRSTALVWLVREMDKTFASIRESTNELRGELGSLRTEMQTRAALPAPEPVVPAVIVEPDSDSLEMWDGWFARDALALVREAQATQRRVGDDLESQRFAEFSASTRAALDTLTATVQTLAARETVVSVAAPQVHLAPTTVHVEPPDVNVAVTMPAAAGKTVTRTSKVIRDDVGAIVGVDTVDTTEETGA